MSIFSFHLAKTTLGSGLNALLNPGALKDVSGLRHAECMAVMALGSPILSADRFQLRKLAVFALWEHEASLDSFLVDTQLGRILAEGWHVRLELLRRWGSVSEFDGEPANAGELEPDSPVVAVTLARLKLPEVPRFIYWGKPVEKLVRNHDAAVLSLAAMRPPRTVSTFSVWRTQREMLEMVRGKGAAPGVERHAAAMTERARRDFHHEFTTLRFRALAEHGQWDGRSNIVPRPV